MFTYALKQAMYFPEKSEIMAESVSSFTFEIYNLTVFTILTMIFRQKVHV